MTTINVSEAMRSASLILGICIIVLGVMLVASDLNNDFGDIFVSHLVFSVALSFMGFLIASTFQRLKFTSQYFGFIHTLLGRGCFMIYVGLSCIPYTWSWKFQSIVGLASIILGGINLIFSCIGSTGNPKDHEEVMLGV